MPEQPQASRLSQPWARLFVFLVAMCFWGAQAAEDTHWIATWTASPQPIWDKSYPAAIRIPSSLAKCTLRQIARISVGGKRLRIVFSNQFGSQPLLIGEAHVALSGGGAKIMAGTDRMLTFGGRPSVTVPPGAPVISDPVELEVMPLSAIAISLYLPEPTALTTFHWDGLQTAYIAQGNATDAADISPSTVTKSRVFLSGILVDAPGATSAVATFGDSITDGNATTPDTNRRWPDILAQRLAKDRVAVVNAGISGARLFKDRMGVNALARFERDVLAQPGVKAVIVLIGINDIGWPGSINPQEPLVSADDLIAGYRQLIAQSHVHGIRIAGGTLTPFKDSSRDGYYTAQKEHVRQAVNLWIRKSGEFDAVVDFDAMVRDPDQPARLLPAYDSGDHLHPNDEGNKAMAEGINLGSLLNR